MVHKSPPRRSHPETRLRAAAPGTRGRPRAYDRETALRRAAETFRQAGFAATSLDDLSAATGMNRPSLYAAFGDKRALYGEILARYRLDLRDRLEAALAAEPACRSALAAAYRAALDVFCAGPRGCLVLATAVTGAPGDADLRGAVAADLALWDGLFQQRLRIARDRGELASRADPAALGRLAAAVLHSLAIRARAGATRVELDRLAEAAAALICDAGREAKPVALFGGTY